MVDTAITLLAWIVGLLVKCGLIWNDQNTNPTHTHHSTDDIHDVVMQKTLISKGF